MTSRSVNVSPLIPLRRVHGQESLRKAKCGIKSFCIFSNRIAPGPKWSEMQQNSLMVALVDDPEQGLPWPLTPVYSSPKTLWDQKKPVLAAPQMLIYHR